MAQIIGRVVETNRAGRAVVVAEKSQGCNSCGAVSHCHGARPAPEHQTTVLNPIGAHVGDRVLLSLASGTLLSRLALLYLLPVATMLMGAFWGAALGGSGGGASNGQSIGFGFTGFILGFGLSILISRIWSRARPVVPIISGIVTNHHQSKTLTPLSGCGCGGR